MDAFRFSELLARQGNAASPYFEFLRRPALSAGVYTLATGETDRQEAHAEDELYFVVAGEATIQVGDEERTVEPGSIVYVAAGVEHRFHTITRDLSLLVFFAGSPINRRTG